MELFEDFNISSRIIALAEQAESELKERFAQFDAVAFKNTGKVLSAFRKNRVSDTMFAGSTGYGYDDVGRDTLDAIYADVFHTERALVRTGFVNGTHTITCALFSAVRPGDTLMYATGTPYDTIHGAIGLGKDYFGSLKFYGIDYDQADLNEKGEVDIKAIREKAANPKVKAVVIQRSRGYAMRPAVTIEQMAAVCEAVRSVNPAAKILVDNCYGEFVDIKEPSDVGADLLAGSLIKNPGAGLAPTGGYLVGKEELVEAASMRLTTPGIGGECGSYSDGYRLMYQGLFMAPHTVAEALKTAAFCARITELLGYASFPSAFADRSDIVQSISFGEPQALIDFCKGIQSASPVDAFVTPVPADMPGYDDQVIMASGTFLQGATIELSCDGPMRPPYTAYLQGGLTYESGKLGIMLAADMLVKK